MKTIFLSFTFTIYLSIFAQSDTLQFDWGERQHILEKRSMITLTSWGGGNLLAGSAGWLFTSGESMYFHQMNAGWGLINMGIGASALLFAKKPTNSPLSFLNRSYKTEKILLFNAGLDIAYVTGGFLLRSMAKNNPENAQRFRGYGNSLLLQGGFLLLFDITQTILHQRLRRNFLNQNGNLSLSSNGIGVVYTFH